MPTLSTVTRDDWHVSSISGVLKDGRVILSVFKVPVDRPGAYRTRNGDQAGRVFANSEEASRFCLERGYTQVYVDGMLAEARWKHGALLRSYHRSAMRAIDQLPNIRSIMRELQDLQANLRGCRGISNRLVTYYFLGWLSAIRGRRPELRGDRS